jgi:hypothetical protein
MTAKFSENPLTSSRFIMQGEREMNGYILIHVPQSCQCLEVTFLKIDGYIQMA